MVNHEEDNVESEVVGQMTGVESQEDEKIKIHRDVGKEVRKVAKNKWVLRADLIKDWRRTAKNAENMQKVSLIDNYDCFIVHRRQDS
ncbi:hypothetical protein C1H46_044055 [Malus baccata]|uniref:Uncharacterized protein n=1 Tax=Malus baccata TaxID=106549 RepID=A0A540K909_MALBA|nr:hypothetical protein C1H46_044055 [Malus baccata]